jgi:hypothetical protein
MHRARLVRIVPLSQQDPHQQTQPKASGDEGAGVLEEFGGREPRAAISGARTLDVRRTRDRIMHDMEVFHLSLPTAGQSSRVANPNEARGESSALRNEKSIPAGRRLHKDHVWSITDPAGFDIVSLSGANLFCRTETSGTCVLPDTLMLALIVLPVLAPAAYAGLCRDICP